MAENTADNILRIKIELEKVLGKLISRSDKYPRYKGNWPYAKKCGFKLEGKEN